MGSYVASSLMQGERVRYETHLSVWSLLPGLTAGACLLLFSVLAYGYAPADVDDGRISLMMAIAFGVCGLMMILAQLSRFYTTEIAITDLRFIFKQGLIRRDTIEMLLEKVESVQVDIPAIGRLFNYGTITIAAAGEDNATVNAVDAPQDLRRAYYSADLDTRDRRATVIAQANRDADAHAGLENV